MFDAILLLEFSYGTVRKMCEFLGIIHKIPELFLIPFIAY